LGKFHLDGIPPSPRGVPQIEVSFDIDENGIMNVHAVDKGTQKTSKITITNNKGRLSKEDIEKLVKEADKFKEDDEKAKKKIEAKNGLENYTYSIRNTLKDEKLKDKFSNDEKAAVEKAVEEKIKWVEANPNAHAEEYESK
jgi:heat shock protein 1/8